MWAHVSTSGWRFVVGQALTGYWLLSRRALGDDRRVRALQEGQRAVQVAARRPGLSRPRTHALAHRGHAPALVRPMQAPVYTRPSTRLIGAGEIRCSGAPRPHRLWSRVHAPGHCAPGARCSSCPCFGCSICLAYAFGLFTVLSVRWTLRPGCDQPPCTSRHVWSCTCPPGAIQKLSALPVHNAKCVPVTSIVVHCSVGCVMHFLQAVGSAQ